MFSMHAVIGTFCLAVIAMFCLRQIMPMLEGFKGVVDLIEVQLSRCNTVILILRQTGQPGRSSTF